MFSHAQVKTSSTSPYQIASENSFHSLCSRWQLRLQRQQLCISVGEMLAELSPRCFLWRRRTSVAHAASALTRLILSPSLRLPSHLHLLQLLFFSATSAAAAGATPAFPPARRTNLQPGDYKYFLSSRTCGSGYLCSGREREEGDAFLNFLQTRVFASDVQQITSNYPI